MRTSLFVLKSVKSEKVVAYTQHSWQAAGKRYRSVNRSDKPIGVSRSEAAAMDGLGGLFDALGYFRDGRPAAELWL
jgi:hypothetical protein